LISEPDAWLAIVNAMLGAAMEGDIEQLRAEFKRNSTFRRKIDVLARARSITFTGLFWWTFSCYAYTFVCGGCQLQFHCL